VNTSKSLSTQLCRFRAAYTVLLPHPKLYITDWYGVSNLPIPQSDPRGHSLNKLESLDRPTSLQQPKKPVSTSHRGVFSQHPHRAPRGSITFLPPLFIFYFYFIFYFILFYFIYFYFLYFFIFFIYPS